MPDPRTALYASSQPPRPSLIWRFGCALLKWETRRAGLVRSDVKQRVARLDYQVGVLYGRRQHDPQLTRVQALEECTTVEDIKDFLVNWP